MHFSCSMKFFQQEIGQITKKAHQKLYFCCRGHNFLCMKVKACVEFHMKHKRGSDFKRLHIAAM